jgi:hypothetical protein
MKSKALCFLCHTFYSAQVIHLPAHERMYPPARGGKAILRRHVFLQVSGCHGSIFGRIRFDSVFELLFKFVA